jgi:hypothetical protein
LPTAITLAGISFVTTLPEPDDIVITNGNTRVHNSATTKPNIVAYKNRNGIFQLGIPYIGMQGVSRSKKTHIGCNKSVVTYDNLGAVDNLSLL